MAKPKAYKPAEGPQQRRKILREVSRQPIRSFQASGKDIRRSVGKMFGFKALTALKTREKAVLRKFTQALVTFTTKKLTHDVWRLKTGRARLWKLGEKGPEEVKADMKTLFSKGKEFYEAKVAEAHEPPYVGATRGLFERWSRGLKEYDYYSSGFFDMIKLTDEAVKRKGGKIKVLDVGSATAKMLAELKKARGEKVETHALSPQDLPREKVDHYHMLTAEFLPAEFRGKFDLIVSNRALEFALLPHRALANIAKSLAPKGKAYIEWQPNRLGVDREVISAAPKEFLAALPKSSIEGKKLIMQHSKEPKQEFEKRLERARRHNPLETRRLLAWCREIARLAKYKNLKVIVWQWGPSPLGNVPYYIIIERKR